jgi:diguanylate cyclase (GGDEF)-like protein/PAS domain S-box-containing protein
MRATRQGSTADGEGLEVPLDRRDPKDNLARAEQELREAGRQLGSVLANIDGLFYRCEVQPPWRMSFTTEGLQELTGYPSDTFDDTPWAQMVHPQDLAEVEAAVASATALGKPFLIEYRILHADGEPRWVREHGRAVCDEAGVPLFLEGIISDISEQRRLEGALAQALEAQSSSARHWHAMLDIIPQMVWTAGPGEGDYYNRRWLEFTGGDGFDFDRVGLVHPDDRERAAAAWAASRGSGEPYQCEYRLRHKSGEYRWILSRGFPDKDAEGNVRRWYGTCTDIHERVTAQEALRASEARFRHILDSLPQNVWTMAGGASEPDYYNKRWYEFTGLPAGSLNGPDWHCLYHPEDLSRVLSTWRRSCETGTPYSCEYRLRRHDGEYRWILSKGEPERDADGRILRWYGTCTDVHEGVLAREAVSRSERRIKTILDHVPQIIWSADANGAVDFLSKQSLGFFGEALAPGDNDWLKVLHPGDRERVAAEWAQCVASGGTYETEFRVLHRSGRYVWTLVRAIPERDPGGRIVRWYGTCTDIDERVAAQQALHESEALSRSMIEASPDCIKLLDLDGNVLFINDAGCRALELQSPAALLGSSWTKSLSPAFEAKARHALEQAKGGEIGRLTLFHPTMTGRPKWWDVVASPVPGENGSPGRVLVISRDITQQKQVEEQVVWTANHDSLTGLANRTLFQNRVAEAIAQARQARGSFALLLLDVDDFKRVNDTLGHDAGDKLLCAFADRLKAGSRADDLVARLGGDEFAVLLAGIGSAQEVEAAVDRLLGRLREPCVYGGRMLDCHASIGASIYPRDGADRTKLLKNADIALYAAKGAGRGNLKLFEPRMRREMQLRAAMLNLAKDALDKGRVLPFYQPKVELRTGRTSGFEALLRWRHPERGIQLPATISAAFQDMTLAAQISDQMIERVIADMREWIDRDVPFGHVAVNAAAAEFRRGDFAERLLERLHKARVPACAIQLEVTETVFLGRGAECVERALKTLSKAGVKIALDDFGTGYASLSHLKQFPVDIIKIDRSFVRDFKRHPDDVAIIKAVVGLGSSLGIKVVAEGIEEEAQHRFLMQTGCEYGQGFLYGKAMPAKDVPVTLARGMHTAIAA